MNAAQQERELEALEREADDIAAFVGSLDSWRLQIIGTAVHEELALRCQGKPAESNMLH